MGEQKLQNLYERVPIFLLWCGVEDRVEHLFDGPFPVTSIQDNAKSGLWDGRGLKNGGVKFAPAPRDVGAPFPLREARGEKPR